MSWFNPEAPKTGTGSAVPKSRSYRAVKPSVTFRTANGQNVSTKSPPTDRGKKS